MSVLCSARAVPVASLIRTYRAHPALNELPNRVAYDGTLVSAITALERPMLTRVMEFPAPGIPFMFVNVDGQSTRAQNMSHFNPAEVDTCTKVIQLLKGRAIAPRHICVITFYREQFRQVEQATLGQGIEISTVDSVQGREKEIVILLTTKTHFTPESADFLDEYRRMNVAMSRCRQGQFILGHVPSLAAVPFWRRVIEWATSLHAIVTPETVERYFHDV
ncbi:hypothetical protein Aduo_012887 [Ancylostoma duodenale]